MYRIIEKDRVYNKALIRIDQDIGTDPGEISAAQFKTELAELAPDCELNIFFNSDGGSVQDGRAIYKMIRSHKGQSTAHVQGIAASIASVIALACDSVLVSLDALFMIHDPFWSTARAENLCSTNGQKLITLPRQFKKQQLITIPTIKTSPRAKIAMMKRSVQKHKNSLSERRRLLETDKEYILNVYHARTGSSREDLRQMMADETWFTASDAVQFGLADFVSAPTGLVDHVDFTKFSNTTNFLSAKYMASGKTARAKRLSKVNRKQVDHMRTTVQKILKQKQEKSL